MAPVSPPRNPMTWGIVAVVLVATALVGLVVYFAIDRRRSHAYRQALQRDPYLTRREFARRRKMSPLERIAEEELQRSLMIRKSLASRAGTQSTLNSSTTSNTSSPSSTTTSRSSSRHRRASFFLDSAAAADRSSLVIIDSNDVPPLPLPPRRFRIGASSGGGGAMSAPVPSLALGWDARAVVVSEGLREHAASSQGETTSPAMLHPSSEQVSPSASIESVPLAHDPLYMSSRTHLVHSVHNVHVHAHAHAHDPITAPQLPRLPVFQDLNEDWRQSTLPKQTFASRLAEAFGAGPDGKTKTRAKAKAKTKFRHHHNNNSNGDMSRVDNDPERPLSQRLSQLFAHKRLSQQPVSQQLFAIAGQPSPPTTPLSQPPPL